MFPKCSFALKQSNLRNAVMKSVDVSEPYPGSLAASGDIHFGRPRQIISDIMPVTGR